MNQLILGDNLEIMKTLESESVDLIYLDPPFCSDRNYEVIWVQLLLSNLSKVGKSSFQMGSILPR